MSDLDRAIADSLHALNFHPHPEAEATVIEAEYRRCLHNILAALDAAPQAPPAALAVPAEYEHALRVIANSSRDEHSRSLAQAALDAAQARGVES